ncbi:MAG: radical SAM protein, partial [bacterium]
DDDFNYLTKMCLSRMRDAAFRMSRIAKEHGCIVIVHGSDSADHLEKYFEHGADYVLYGEAETTLVELLDFLLHGKGVRGDIQGVAYPEGGLIHRTGARRPRQDLDILPFPSWDLVDVELYRKTWTERHGYFSVNMVTTRGCPFHCNWCAKPVYGQVYNSRSPENVVAEMKRMKETIRPDHIWFCDDIFGLKPGWIQSFADEVNRRDAMIPFKCLGRVDLLVKDDTIEALRRAGCTSVWVGAESGSQKILDAMEKGTTVEQIYQATKKLKQSGIKVGFFLQYGYSGETQDDIALTLRMVKDCMPDDIGISVSYPLPGTTFYERVKAQLGEKTNWTESADLDMMYHGTYSADFYRALHAMTHKKFRVWQTADLLRKKGFTPWKSSPAELRRIVAGAYHLLTLPNITNRVHSLAIQSEN